MTDGGGSIVSYTLHSFIEGREAGAAGRSLNKMTEEGCAAAFWFVSVVCSAASQACLIGTVLQLKFPVSQ